MTPPRVHFSSVSSSVEPTSWLRARDTRVLNPIGAGLRISPFIMGAVAAQQVDILGQLYVGEVLAVLILLPSLLRMRLPAFERRLVLLAALWSVAQLLSDLYSQTPLGTSVKGVFAPLLFVATILGVQIYFRADMRRMPSFLMGVVIGAGLQLAYNPSTYYGSNPWKWGIGAMVLGVFAIHYSFFLRRKSLLGLSVALVVFAVVSLEFEARSMAALPLVAGFLYAAFRVGLGARFIRAFRGRLGVLWLLPLVAIAILLMNMGASALFSSEALQSRVSPQAGAKYQGQAQGRYGLLLGGRSEFLVSARAFLDSPILGHGSWAVDRGGYRQAYLDDLQNDLGYSASSYGIMSSPLIPTHSYLMGALVWSGIVGGLFWVALLYLAMSRFIRTATRLPFYFYVGMVAFTWDVLFSPFGAGARWSTAIFFAAFLTYTRAIGESRVAE